MHARKKKYRHYVNFRNWVTGYFATLDSKSNLNVAILQLSLIIMVYLIIPLKTRKYLIIMIYVRAIISTFLLVHKARFTRTLSSATGVWCSVLSARTFGVRHTIMLPLSAQQSLSERIHTHVCHYYLLPLGVLLFSPSFDRSFHFFSNFHSMCSKDG